MERYCLFKFSGLIIKKNYTQWLVAWVEKFYDVLASNATIFSNISSYSLLAIFRS
jgi:hypothetical protein